METGILILVNLILCIGGVFLFKVSMLRLEKRELSIEEENRKKINKRDVIFGLAVLMANIILLAIIKNTYPEQIMVKIIIDMLVITLLMVSTVTDFKFHIIPNEVIITGAVAWIILTVYKFFAMKETIATELIDEILALIIITVFLFLCNIIMKNSIGGGDIKILMLLSLYYGIIGVYNIVFLALIGAFFVSLVLLISKRRNTKDAIAFAPFFLVGAYLGIILSGL